MKKVLGLLGSSFGLSFAHIKPVPHEHIGFLHPEDILLVGVVIALVGGAFLLGFKLSKRRA